MKYLRTSLVNWIHNIEGFITPPTPTNVVCEMPLLSDLSLTVGTGTASYTRTGDATYLDNSSGFITTVPTDTPRFEAQGFLSEGSITNLLPSSEDFSEPAWTHLSSATTTSDQALSPDGNLTSDLNDLVGISSRIHNAAEPTAPANTDFMYSVWVRSVSGTGTYPLAYRQSNNTFNGVTVDLTETHDRKEILIEGVALVLSDLLCYSGNRLVGIGTLNQAYTWGAQLEQLKFASSYIPTTATSVTRDSDDLSIDPANIPAPTVDYSISFSTSLVGLDDTLSQVLFNVEGESTRRIEWDTTTGTIKATHGGVTCTSTSTFSAGEAVTVCFAVDGTNQTLYINEVQEDQQLKGTVTGTATNINIGHQAGTNHSYSRINSLKTYNEALTFP